MTLHRWIAVAIFFTVGTILHQPGANSLETGLIAALAAGLFLVMVEAWREKM